MQQHNGNHSMKNQNNTVVLVFRIVGGIVLTIALLYALFILFVLWAMFSTHRDGLYILYTFVIVLTVYVFLLKQLILWRKPKKRGVLPFIGILVVAVLAWVITAQYYSRIDRIPVFAEDAVNVSLKRFEPFKPGSPVAVLPQKAALTLSEDLPQFDCALALYPVVTAFVQAVYDEDASREVIAKRGGLYYYSPSPAAWESLTNGHTDIILATVPSAAQVEYAREKGVEFVLTPIGKEAFVFFVNVENPVDGLTVAQLQDIYGGKITGWKQVGGKNWRIRAFQRNEGSGSQNTLVKFMAGKPLMSPPQNENIGGMGGIVSHIANYKNFKNALGFSFRYFVQEIMGEEHVKMLAINGVYPDKASIRDGSYPLAYDFYAVTRADNANPNVDEFIQWMLSPQGQYLIEASGYVAIGASEVNAAD